MLLPTKLVLCLSLLSASGSCTSPVDVATAGTAGVSPPNAGVQSLDPAQKASLEQLKTAVSPNVPHDYMKQDAFLLNFLQASNFNATQAETKVNEMVKWRKTAGVDSWDLPGNKLDVFAANFPSLENGVAKDGTPIREAPFGKWNIRSSMLSGTNVDLANYAIRSIERSTARVRDQQAKGANVSQWTMLLNMEGFGVNSAGCASCLTVYLAYVTKLESFYPNSLKEVILVNTPDAFGKFYALVKPALSEATLKSVTIFGDKQADWKPYLDERVAADQLADWFGGSKVAPKLKEEKKLLGGGIGKK